MGVSAPPPAFRRDKPLRSGYVLEYVGDLPVAVVEARRWRKGAAGRLEHTAGRMGR
ncbi:hypothetical protein SMC26_03420 [Actinomadura fulvescens]|uniref:Uncharacterized protein n=1 Tax=Actinomadura fulvescens TaxID=46160 RepID=A0ABN3PXG1_9ACTN